MVVMDHGVCMFPCQSQDCFLPPSSPLLACFRPWWAWSRLTEFPPNPSHIRTRLRHPTTHCCKTRPPYLSKAMFCCLQLSGVKGTTQCAALEPCFDPPSPLLTYPGRHRETKTEIWIKRKSGPELPELQLPNQKCRLSGRNKRINVLRQNYQLIKVEPTFMMTEIMMKQQHMAMTKIIQWWWHIIITKGKLLNVDFLGSLPPSPSDSGVSDVEPSSSSQVASPSPSSTLPTPS